MRESKNLEFKESVTNTFLKTVSAFANYGTGKILFGVMDNGVVKGIENPEKVCLDIENRINDSLDPVPEYILEINERTSVITLTVSEGLHKPYLYKAKAYRRNDSATVPVDRLSLTRLILEGQNLSFEESVARNQELHFAVLERKLKTVLHLENVTPDTLKTLELYKDGEGFTVAAELLADQNSFSGIDMIRFGDSINILLDRELHERESILTQYDAALSMYRKYYQYEQINGSERETVILIPEAAYREAVANALVHRTWDVETNIHVEMFPDKIEITSPGGLPQGVTKEEYLRGGLSVLRNRIIGNLFFRLHLIERFGTGIRRIKESYKDNDRKPIFEVFENSIKIMLPVMDACNALTADENRIYLLIKRRALPSSSLVEETGFGKTKVVSILRRLMDKGYVQSVGNGRGTKYTAEAIK
ncbi:ATP-binding protein [uncultured Succiniclasticum sp.]|uniref:ATP-binding protein n=1 Tax=uncultured Succiniclasticum sp. TaxID=1500547 RepID=UPI0025E3B4AF|nr:ATP-binding protein [uncultured Succiniclasticum sp.]